MHLPVYRVMSHDRVYLKDVPSHDSIVFMCCLCTSLKSNAYTYIRTYIHTFIHTYIHTYTHSHIHTFTHSHIHTFIHSYIHTFIHTYIHTYIHIYIHTYIHTCVYIYIHMRYPPPPQSPADQYLQYLLHLLPHMRIGIVIFIYSTQ